MRILLLPVFLVVCLTGFAQKHVYDVILFGKKVGSTTVERIDKGNGIIEYKLNHNSEVNMLFAHKSSFMSFDVIYSNNKLYSSSCKNVKDGVTEITTLVWDGNQYVINRDGKTTYYKQQVDYTTMLLYYFEPVSKTKVFSERLGEDLSITTLAKSEYQFKVAGGATNTYRYRNGTLYEIGINKGASVYLKLVQ